MLLRNFIRSRPAITPTRRRIAMSTTAATTTVASEVPTVVDMPERRFWALMGHGPFHTCGSTFAKLDVLAKEAGLSEQASAMLVLCDVPHTAKEDLVWACGIHIMDDGTEHGHSAPQEMVELKVPAGKYATVLYRGEYAGLPKAWGNLCHKWIPSQGLSPRTGTRDMPHYEVYLSMDPMETQLFCPV
mmetsp:Transcript_9194/g.18505  ORF Transcript_9194/g.18505 Transcript_9194/m.18505 type:complete len:187 (-) Transcript_9194:274-834(-)